jgi:hypothetical protein
MTTPIGTPVQYRSTTAEGYDGAVLPGVIAASGPGLADDGATIVAFGTDGRVLVRVGVMTAATFEAIGGVHGGCWGPVA